MFNLIKIEIYANHLNTLVGGGESTQQAKKSENIKENKILNDPSVDFHLSLLGKKIKMQQLFKGYTSMIALVWNLPTKPTSIFNINLLLSDENQFILLSNGLTVGLQTLGALSVDLSGMGEVSFWSMYANTNVKLR